MRRLDLIGQKFGRLTVLRYEATTNRNSTWLCRCDCGNERVFYGCHLKRGKTDSCGCRYGRWVHGGARTHLHFIWCSMIQRCHNPNDRQYANYGGRGITVCDRWRYSFANFRADMGERPAPKMSIDRIENDRGYAPFNCHWVTQKEQAMNTRRSRKAY